MGEQQDAGKCELVVGLPQSVLSALESFAAESNLTLSQAFSKVLEGLPGLDPSEIQSFEEPRKKKRTTVRFLANSSLVCVLDDFSLRSGLSRSSICRRILFALLFTQEIAVYWSFSKRRNCLKRTQLVFPFFQEKDLSASRQHSEKT
jgi:hypothetical protein